MDNTNKTPQSGQILLDTSALHIIKGRLEPHIYAFKIDSFPPSYKIGDTFRDVDIRIDEWRKIYHALPLTHNSEWEWSAMIEDRFFRDYAVHKYLEEEKGRKILEQEVFGDYHISKEFYRDTEINEIEDAINYIRENAPLPESSYKLYSAIDSKDDKFDRNIDMKLRENQEEVVSNFITAYNKGRKNLLMYAVMRFGKTFTALCCAQKINAKTILVVSAKADVASGWSNNVQSIIQLENFNFYIEKDLKKLDFEKELAEGNTVVLFMTLQALQGIRIKQKHEKIFNENRIWDMVIVDETHFGARGLQYGIPLLEADWNDREDRPKKGENAEDIDEELKYLKRKVTLHLSGTPYRILMTNEFKDEDLIACVRYPDILKARDDWFAEHVEATNGETGKSEEWDNPYFGFPQMVRFAFNLNEESLGIIKEMEDKGYSAKFANLFGTLTRSKKPGSDSYRTFRHEKEVLSFLQVIDGTKDDENVLGFLDNERIKQGMLCRHVVMVLPFRASCDAMVNLIARNKNKFRNLGDYELINIAGLDSSDKPNRIGKKISGFEKKDKKTLSFTVRKMLTGVTVPEWDTMIFLKEASSPEEYDQAMYRLQNKFIKTYQNPDGTIVKYDMKPQTIFVDFDPQRMFRLQEKKCSIYNSASLLRDKGNISDFIDEELNSSPIIYLDHHKLRQIDSTDLMDEIRKYAQARGIPEEAMTIPIDITLLKNNDIFKAISKLNGLLSKDGIRKEANAKKGKGDDVTPFKGEGKNEASLSAEDRKNKKEERENIEKKLAAYYSMILYFAFLTPDRVHSIKDIIDIIDKGENARIAEHLELDKHILELIADAHPWTILSLDKSINDTNYTATQSGLSQEEMIDVVLKRCKRLSEAEIVTPAKIADEMVALLPDDLFEREGIVLDIASKQGEFAVALNKRYGKKYPEQCKERIYSVCTSGLAYEFTRKIYKYLGFNVENIIEDVKSMDIIANKLADKKKGKYLTVQEILGKDVKINTIIGNPPYQIMDGGTQSSATPVYNMFVEAAKIMSSPYISMIMPSRWFAGGKGLETFRNEMISDQHISYLYDFLNGTDVFNNYVEIKGGICFFLRNTNYRGNCHIFTYENGKISSEDFRLLKEKDSNVFIRYKLGVDIYRKVVSKSNENFSQFVSQQKPFGLRTFVKGSPIQFTDTIKLYENGGIGYIGLNDIKKNRDWISLPKVYISRAYNAGDNYPHQIIGKPILSLEDSCCTETYVVIGPFKDSVTARNVEKYICTRFFRALVMLKKASQQAAATVYEFVPMQNFTENSDIKWHKSIDEIDQQLFEKYQLSSDEVKFIKTMIKRM